MEPLPPGRRPAAGAARPDGGRVRRPGVDLRPVVVRLPPRRIIVAVARADGRDRLLHIAPGDRIGEVETPFTEFDALRVGAGRRSWPSPASPTEAPAVVVQLDPTTLAPAGVLRRTSATALDPATVSVPEVDRLPDDRRAHGARAVLPADEPGVRGARTASGRRWSSLSHGGPTVERLHGARPRDPAADQPRHRRRRRRLRRQHRLRPRPTAASSTAQWGDRRRRRLRRRRAVPRRSRRRGPRPAGHRGRQRRAATPRSRALAFQRRVRGRDQPLRRRRPRDARARHPQVRVALPGRPGRAVPGHGGPLPRALADPCPGPDRVPRPRPPGPRRPGRAAGPGRGDRRGPGANGIPHAYLAFEGEGHGFRGAAAIRRTLEAELSFLGAVFGFTPADDLPPLELPGLDRLAAAASSRRRPRPTARPRTA